MRLIERPEVPEEHFTEGEPDLEAPEELCVAEIEEEQVLEEDLDNEDVSEEDVDELVLETTLEHLVAQSEPELDDEDAAWERLESSTSGRGLREEAADADGANSELGELADLEVADLEDLEESLDRILAQRLSSDEADADDSPRADGAALCPCRDDEFVCSSCYLVHKRTQLADATSGVCLDCAG